MTTDSTLNKPTRVWHGGRPMTASEIAIVDETRRRARAAERIRRGWLCACTEPSKRWPAGLTEWTPTALLIWTRTQIAPLACPALGMLP